MTYHHCEKHGWDTLNGTCRECEEEKYDEDYIPKYEELSPKLKKKFDRGIVV